MSEPQAKALLDQVSCAVGEHIDDLVAQTRSLYDRHTDPASVLALIATSVKECVPVQLQVLVAVAVMRLARRADDEEPCL